MLLKKRLNANIYFMSKVDLKVLNKNVGRIIRITRLRKGETQLGLGAEVNLSGNQIGRIERGIGNPTIKTLYNICTYLSITIDKLFVTQTEGKIEELEIEIKTLEILLKKKNKKK